MYVGVFLSEAGNESWELNHLQINCILFKLCIHVLFSKQATRVHKKEQFPRRVCVSVYVDKGDMAPYVRRLCMGIERRMSSTTSEID